MRLQKGPGWRLVITLFIVTRSILVFGLSLYLQYLYPKAIRQQDNVPRTFCSPPSSEARTTHQGLDILLSLHGHHASLRTRTLGETHFQYTYCCLNLPPMLGILPRHQFWHSSHLAAYRNTSEGLIIRLDGEI